MFFKKKITIKFIATSQDTFSIYEKPQPASKFIPKWLKDTPHYISLQPHERRNLTVPDKLPTIRRCMPILDIITAGYYITLPGDMWVSDREGDLHIEWSKSLSTNFFSTQQPQQYTSLPLDENLDSRCALKVDPDWVVKTPKGWSCLFLHPSYHNDLPFKVLPALVDTDKHPIPVSIVFFIKKNFKGLIPKGTPLVQIIPFKREEFVGQFKFYKNNLFANTWKKAATVFFDAYKNNFRTLKKFKIEDKSEYRENKCPFARFFSNKK